MHHTYNNNQTITIYKYLKYYPSIIYYVYIQTCFVCLFKNKIFVTYGNDIYNEKYNNMSFI